MQMAFLKICPIYIKCIYKQSIPSYVQYCVLSQCFSCLQTLDTQECSTARKQPLGSCSAIFPGYTHKDLNPVLQTAKIGWNLVIPGMCALLIFQHLIYWLLKLSALPKENPSELKLFL